MTNPNINSFALTPIVGDVSLQGAGIITTARVDPNLATPIIPGQAVKIMDTAGGTPQVTAMTSLTDAAWGVALYNVKDQNYPANASLELGQRNTFVNMTAGAAISRGQYVEFVYTTNKVVTNTSSAHPTLGIAYDKASADGDIIRVMIDAPNPDSTSA